MSSPPSWRARPTWLCWSGGKESAWALRVLRAGPAWDVRGLIGLVNEKNGRAILHGVRHTLLEQQAAAVGLPLRLIPLDWTASGSEHDAAVRRGLSELRADGAECVAFGNLFSPSARERRVLATNGTGLEPVFPLWGLDTRDHCAHLLEADVSAWVCSVDTGSIPADLAGRRFDASFVAALPQSVDPCGENDEFHTFVEWVPGWNHRVRVEPAGTIRVYDFAFVELELSRQVDATPGAGAVGEQPPAFGTDPFHRFARLARVLRYVDDHLADDLNVDAIAKVAAMSPWGFSKYFRQHAGVTFARWLARHRIEHACRLLRETNFAVARVGESIGYNSERTFRRAFQEHLGCSPSQYKKASMQVDA